MSKWRIKLNPEKTRFIMFSRTLKETANKPALFVYGMQLSYFPHAKLLGITFGHKFTFEKHLPTLATLPTKMSLECWSTKSGDHAHKQFCKSLNNM